MTHFVLRSAGYEWLKVNKQKSNFVKVPASNIKTLSSNVTTIFAVPSSKTSTHDVPLKNLAKQRLKSRYDLSSFTSFDDAMKVRNSCHIIEQSGSDFLCDCHEGKDIDKRRHYLIHNSIVKASWSFLYVHPCMKVLRPVCASIPWDYCTNVVFLK